MKILKTLLIFSLFSTSVSLHAQKFYVLAGAGYGFTMEPQFTYIAESSHSYDGNGDTYSYSMGPRRSYGKGLQINAGFGYALHKNISLELGLGYLKGATFTDHVKNSYSDKTSAEINSNINVNMVRAIPGLRMSTTIGNFHPYFRAGLILGWVNQFKWTRSYSATDGSGNSYREREYKGDITLGYYSGLGVTCDITKRLGLFVEFTAISQSFSPTKSEMTSYISNGNVQDLSKTEPFYKSSEYVDSYNSSTSTPADLSRPQKLLKEHYGMNSIGFTAGLIFRIGKAEEAAESSSK